MYLNGFDMAASRLGALFESPIRLHQSLSNPASASSTPVGSIGRPCIGNGQKRGFSNTLAARSTDACPGSVGFGPMATAGFGTSAASALPPQTHIKSSSMTFGAKKLRLLVYGLTRCAYSASDATSPPMSTSMFHFFARYRSMFSACSAKWWHGAISSRSRIPCWMASTTRGGYEGGSLGPAF